MKDSTYQKEVTERIRKLIDERGVTPAAYAKLINISQAGISTKLNGKSPWTTIDIRNISKLENVSPDWILHGEIKDELKENEIILEYQESSGNFNFNSDRQRTYEETSGYTTIAKANYDLCSEFCNRIRAQFDFKNKIEYPDSDTIKDLWNAFMEEKDLQSERDKDRKRIPLISNEKMMYNESIAAGLGNNVTSFSRDDYYVIPAFADKKVDFMVHAYGESMTPTINSGDLLACRVVIPPYLIRPNEIYAVATINDSFVKRVIPIPNSDLFEMVSDNERYAPFRVRQSDILSLAMVVGVVSVKKF